MKEKDASEELSGRKTRSKESNVDLPEVDDQTNLPVGTEFDFIIKRKAEEIDSQKLHNNQKMDELVTKLGYMDYRDALACNKYIIEAKRSGDYHQSARGRVLEVAFGRMTKEKQAKIRTDAKAKAQDKKEDV